MKREFSLLIQTFRETVQNQGQDLAATIAFWSFFSIFPLLIGVLSLAGYLLESAQLQSRIYEVVNDLFPGSAVLVRDNLEAVVHYRGTLTWVGIGGLLWTSAKGFGAITRAVNRALDAKPTHFYLLLEARYVFMAFAVSILMITSISITVAIEIVLHPSLLSRLGLGSVEIPRLQGWTLSLLLVFLIFALIYKLAPYVNVQWHQVLPGALLAALLFELVKSAFVLYLDRVAHFEAMYGSLSSIIALLLWLYLSALILILGAEYNIVRWKARAGMQRV